MPTAADWGAFIVRRLFLGTNDFAKYLAKEFDATFNVAVGGGVDGEAVYAVDHPAREDLSHLVGVAYDYLRAELVRPGPLVGDVGVGLGNSLRMGRSYAAADQEAHDYFGAVPSD
jgi:hypothetical protein